MPARQKDAKAAAAVNLTWVEQALRCYMVPTSGPSFSQGDEREDDEDDAYADNEVAQAIRQRSQPYGGYCLILDTETYSFKGAQRARFGAYQIRGITVGDREVLHEQGGLDDNAFRLALDTPYARGLFYNPDWVPEAEVQELKAYIRSENKKAQIDPWTGNPLPKLEKLLSLQDFVQKVLYPWAEACGEDLLILGHNLGFDLGALCFDQGLASKKLWYGGFTMKLCDCPPKIKQTKKGESEDRLSCFQHPPIQVKPLGGKKRMFGWRTEGTTETIDGERVPRKKKIKANFLDTAQFARALLGPINTSLEHLTWEVLKTETKKSSGFEDYDGPINRDYIAYCVNDVQATFEVWAELRALYRKHGISTPPWQIYSEASLGKGYYAEFGVPRFLTPEAQAFVPNWFIGQHLQSYYGGRSEVRIRKEIREVIHTDFKSQYPSVNALLGLQELLLAKDIEITPGKERTPLAEYILHEHLKGRRWDQGQRQTDYDFAHIWVLADRFEEKYEPLVRFVEQVSGKDANDPKMWKRLVAIALEAPATETLLMPELRTFLDEITLERLQDPATWRNPLMRSIVRIVPNNDILPVRAEYEEDGDSTNIGINIVESGLPVWHTLCDAIASKLVTGKAPTIDDAIMIGANGEVETTPFPLFGEERYLVDLKRDDLFTRLIDLRTEMQKRGEKELEQATKLLANATSYGVLAQFDIDRRTGDYKTRYDEYGNKTRRGKPGFPVDIYTNSQLPDPITVSRLETPGDYFAGPIATHISAGGRLLLAMAEKFASDRGISHVFCDTDSMCFAKPEGMKWDEFKRLVQEVVDEFVPLYPYRCKVDDKGKPLSLLQFEEENYRDGEEEKGFEPLYALTVSAKRYALFNRLQFEQVFGRLPSKAEPKFYPRFRKISAHGTGQITEPATYQPSTPEPSGERVWKTDAQGKLKSEPLSNRAVADRLLTDIWRKAIMAIDAEVNLDLFDPQLDVPVMSDVTLGSRGMWQRYGSLPEKRPFMFFSMLPHPRVSQTGVDLEGLKEIANTTLYGKRAKSYEDIKATLHRADTHEPFNLEDWQGMVRLRTLNDVFAVYFDREEWKSFPPDGVGPLERRRLIIASHIPIGKETDQIKDEENEETEGEFAEETKPDPALQRAAVFNSDILSASSMARLGISLAELSRKTGFTQDQLSDWKAGRSMPDTGQRRRLIASLHHLKQCHGRWLNT
ncbi:MAG: helix-turn-helix transcriptional regulator [Rhodomicrobium sp.]